MQHKVNPSLLTAYTATIEGDRKELKRLIKHAENPKYSKDDQSIDFLSEGEMLDYVLDKLKELTRIKHRLNN